MIVYDCDSIDDVRRCVFLSPDQQVEDELNVEARSIVIDHRPAVSTDGTRFVGFREGRLVEAVRLLEKPQGRGGLEARERGRPLTIPTDHVLLFPTKGPPPILVAPQLLVGG